MINTPSKLREYYSDVTYISFDENGDGLSCVHDSVWDFAALEQSTKKVRFTGIKDLTHRANAQRYIAALHDHLKLKSTTKEASINKLMHAANTLSSFVKQCDLSDLSSLSNDRVWRDFKIDLKGRYAKASLENFSSIMNTFADAKLCERRFPRSEYIPLAIKGYPCQQAIAIPPSMHAQMLQDLVRTVDTYYPHRYAISKAAGEYFADAQEELERERKKHGTDELTRRVIRNAYQRVKRRRIKSAKFCNIPNLDLSIQGEWVTNLVCKCYMVVGLFSGARDRELLTMTPGKYEKISGVPTIKGSKTKGNAGRAATRAWVTHPIALKALELAQEVTQFARKVHLSVLEKNKARDMYSVGEYNQLKKELRNTFITVSLTSYNMKIKRARYLTDDMGKNMRLDMFNFKATEEDIREFDLLNPARFGDLELGGTLPKLTPHDLRRSFAVFMVRNRLGGLQTIKRQFGHENLQMSGWYANNADLARIEDLLLDSELMDMCDEAMEDAAVDALDEIYNASGVLSGRQGDRISKNKEDALRRGEQMYLSRSELRAFVRSGEKSIVMLPTGAYCTNPSCERLCTVGFFNSDSKPCEHQVVTDRSAKVQAKERLYLAESFRGMNDLNDYALSSILSGMKQKILYLEQTLKVHNIEFEPFTDKINVVEV